LTLKIFPKKPFVVIMSGGNEMSICKYETFIFIFTVFVEFMKKTIKFHVNSIEAPLELKFVE